MIANDRGEPGSLLAAWQSARGPVTEKDVRAIVRERAADYLREQGINVEDPAALDAAWNNREVLWRFAGRQVHVLQEMMRSGAAVRLPRLGSLSERLKELREQHAREWEEASRTGMTREAFDLRLAQRRVADTWPSPKQAA